VSVFIAFTSIAATLLMAEQLLARDWARRHLARWTTLVAVVLCVFAFWDQTTPPCIACLRASKDNFDNDARFVTEIEKQVPDHSAIYQLPYVGFPEVPPVNELGTYDPARGYLNSGTLKWSWGAMKGRSGDLFFRGLATEPVERQIAIARRLCFSGVYLDRRGYADGGVAIEAQLQRILGKPPVLVSASKQQIFFNLNDRRQAACTLPHNVTPEQIMEREDLVVNESGVRYHATLSDGINFSRAGLPDFLTKLDGLSGVEPWGRWSDASDSPAIHLRFAQPLPTHFILHLRAQGFGPNAGRPAQVTIGDETQAFSPTVEPADYALSFNNPGGANLIAIAPAKPMSPHDLGISGDGRKIGLGVERLWIESSR
jgi:phosphoglycerol transferase